jgi:hypothetical protein
MRSCLILIMWMVRRPHLSDKGGFTAVLDHEVFSERGCNELSVLKIMVVVMGAQ